MRKKFPHFTIQFQLCVYVYYVHDSHIHPYLYIPIHVYVRQDGRESTPGWNAERPMSKNVGKKDNAEDRNR